MFQVRAGHCYENFETKIDSNIKSQGENAIHP